MRTKPKGLKKTGGRKKGTPNKITLDFVAKLEALGADPLADLYRDILEIKNPNQRAYIRLQMLDYIYPRRKPVDSKGDDKPDEFNVIVKWADESDKNPNA